MAGAAVVSEHGRTLHLTGIWFLRTNSAHTCCGQTQAVCKHSVGVCQPNEEKSSFWFKLSLQNRLYKLCAADTTRQRSSASTHAFHGSPFLARCSAHFDVNAVTERECTFLCKLRAPTARSLGGSRWRTSVTSLNENSVQSHRDKVGPMRQTDRPGIRCNWFDVKYTCGFISAIFRLVPFYRLLRPAVLISATALG